VSGSSILQNGRIVGTVTHVFVNDPSVKNKILSISKLRQDESPVFFCNKNHMIFITKVWLSNYKVTEARLYITHKNLKKNYDFRQDFLLFPSLLSSNSNLFPSKFQK